MAATPPPVIRSLPLPPDPNDRSTFNARAYPWSLAQADLADDVGAVASNVYGNAVAAAQSADDSDTAKGLSEQARSAAQQAVLDAQHQVALAVEQAQLAAAASAAAAVTWVAGATYPQNKLVWLDASTGVLFRCIQPHTGRNQTPDTDPAYWTTVDAGSTLSTKLQGLDLSDDGRLLETDTALKAFGKLQARVMRPASVSLTYANRRISKVTVDGRDINFSYGPSGRLSSVSYAVGTKTRTETFTYSDGLVASITATEI